MKTKLHFSLIVLMFFDVVHQVAAQGTAFSYQGQLQNNSAAANGSYDLQFILFNTNQFGFPAAPILTNTAVAVDNGLFTTTLDFGEGVFSGMNLWIEISVRTNGNGAFNTLAPRQPITPAPYAITAENLSGVVENNAIQNGVSLATISGGGGNVIQSGANNATIGGGGYNTIQSGADHSTIGGGYSDEIQGGAWESFIGGGQGNFIESNAVWSAIGGGLNNVIQTNATYSAILGGWGNTIYASYSFIGGGYFNTIQTGANFSTIGGGQQNTIQSNASYSTIGGGYINVIQTNANFSVIGGGIVNTIQPYATYSTIGGGRNNTVQTNGQQSFIGGGYQNTVQANAQNDFIGGGYFNVIQANAYASTIGGGGLNTNGGSYSTIPGGYNNTANGSFSFAAGQQAQATNNGAFVWADSVNATFSSTANNQFLIRATGGVGINTTSPQQALSVVGGVNVDQNGQNATGNVNNNGLTFGSGSGEGIASQRTGTGNVFDLVLCTKFLPRLTILQSGFVGVGVTPTTSFQVGLATCNGLTWNNSSDRNSKENFTAINPRAVLEKVSAMPITEWKYKMEAHGIQHIGPMAQDFHAAFGLDGTDDKHISTVDEGGVALAAIQGLNQKLQSEMNRRDSENAKLKQQNELLFERLNELEMAVKSISEKK